MKKVFLIGLLALASLSSYANAQNTKEWLNKVSNHIDYHVYQGKLSAFKSCSLTIGPSDKKGVMVVIESTKLLDIFGTHDKTVGYFHVLPKDVLTGSREYPQPFESKNVLAFGYNEDNGQHTALVIKTINSKKIDVTIETEKNGNAADAATCSVNIK